MKSLWRDRSGRVALLACALLLATAAGADLLASDVPWVTKVDGQLHWFPKRPTVDLSRAEWTLWAPIPFGPLQTVGTTGEVRDQPPPWAPDSKHWLGTDELGRDVAARLIHGARISLFVGFVTTLIAVLVGLAIGALAGALGGWVDAALSRLIELTQTFPVVFLLLAVLSLVRSQTLWPLVLALALTRWTEVARLVRAEVLSLRGRPFILAARALGASKLRLVLRHFIPNAMGPVIVSATFAVGSAILLESALSFLGMGVAPPHPSWGELLTEAHRTLLHPGAWWLAVFPGLAIAGTVLAVHTLGQALRRTFDARP